MMSVNLEIVYYVRTRPTIKIAYKKKNNNDHHCQDGEWCICIQKASGRKKRRRKW